jgi:predicted transposase YdaD
VWYARGVPGPFDTTLKALLQAYPADWLAFVGVDAAGPINVIDANLSAVSAEVDKVMGIDGPSPRLLHVEFQSSYDPTIGLRLARYNLMLHVEHERRVTSVLVLLRRAAAGPSTSGLCTLAFPDEDPYLTFRFGVRRVWEEPAADLLRGALGTLPLVPLGASEPAELPGLLRAADERFTREATLAEAAQPRVMTYTLLGLRFPPAVADQLMPGIRNMRDSLTYQAIVEEGVERGLVQGRAEGRVEMLREMLLRQGEDRFGPVSEPARALLVALDDPDHLQALSIRILHVASWDELLHG